ncbi:MAG: lipid II:glycine glycyltransferase FemX [Anaerolineae bacterium]
MQILRVADPETWDQTLLNLPNPHILQSWAWGEFKSRHGWQATRLLFVEGDQIRAAASVLQRRLPGLPVSLLYVPKGPALDWNDLEQAAQVLAALEGWSRSQKAGFIKIDPDVYYPEGTPPFSPRPACAPAIACLLTARGWRFSNEQVQFRNTVLLDLARSEDELLAAMKSKFRYNVQLATRRGVVIRSGAPTDLEQFYQLYAETARRDGFPIRPPDYYLDAWECFIRTGQAHLFLAEVEGEAIAGLMLFTFGPTAWYFYGASADRHRQLMPNNLLQWEAIRHARAMGCTLYDLWGAPDHLEESDPMWGVVRFKLGLGGQLVQGLGAWDFPTRPMLYWLCTLTIPRYLNWLRGWQPAQGGHP